MRVERKKTIKTIHDIYTRSHHRREETESRVVVARTIARIKGDAPRRGESLYIYRAPVDCERPYNLFLGARWPWNAGTYQFAAYHHYYRYCCFPTPRWSTVVVDRTIYQSRTADQKTPSGIFNSIWLIRVIIINNNRRPTKQRPPHTFASQENIVYSYCAIHVQYVAVWTLPVANAVDFTPRARWHEFFIFCTILRNRIFIGRFAVFANPEFLVVFTLTSMSMLVQLRVRVVRTSQIFEQIPNNLLTISFTEFSRSYRPRIHRSQKKIWINDELVRTYDHL